MGPLEAHTRAAMEYQKGVQGIMAVKEAYENLSVLFPSVMPKAHLEQCIQTFSQIEAALGSALGTILKSMRSLDEAKR
jgi:hypothetical protein